MAEPNVVLPAHEQYGLPFDFTTAEDTLVTGGFDGTVRVWATEEWTETMAIEAHDQSVNCGETTASGTLVTGSTDTTVREWDLEDGGAVGTLTGHSKTVAGLAAHPSRRLVASASYDATVRIWDLASDGVPTALSGHPGNVTSVVFVDDETVASGGIGDELFVWSLADAAVAERFGGHGDAVVGITGGRGEHLWTVDHSGTVHRFSPDDWTEVDAFDVPDDAPPSGIALAPDGESLAVTKSGGVLVFDTQGRLRTEHETSVKGISTPIWSPDGTWLAVGGADGNVRLYR